MSQRGLLMLTRLIDEAESETGNTEVGGSMHLEHRAKQTQCHVTTSQYGIRAGVI